MLRRVLLYVWVVVVFVASEVLARHLGIRFASETLGTLYQYLDPAILREDLVRGLYYLHAQPPLFNLFLGVVVKLFPGSYSAVFSAVFGAMALGTLMGMAWLMRCSEIPDVVSGAVCLLFALSPNFLVYRNWLFYTLPVAFLLVASAVALTLYLKHDSRAALIALSGLLLSIMLTRSVFHPLWLAIVAVALVGFVAERKSFLIACAAPLLLVGIVLFKNYALVGEFTNSTWLGLSLTKRWPLSQREVAELKSAGIIPEMWQRRPFQEPDDYREFGYFETVSNEHPALGAPYKSNGEPNFNHRDFVAISNVLFAADTRLIRRFPGRYLRRVMTATLLFLQPGPNSVHFLVDYDFERVHRYRDAWTQYAFWGGRIERPIRMLEPPANLMVWLFPVVLVVGVAGARGQPRGPFVFMLVCIVWVTAVTNLIEIGENDRMRWEVEPFLAILFAFAVSRGLLLVRRLKWS